MAAGRFDEAASALRRDRPGAPERARHAHEPRHGPVHGRAAARGRPPPPGRPESCGPISLPASLFLGAAYMELGQPAKAVPPLQKFVAAQPDHREARQMLADALLSLERCEPAAREYRALSEQDPQDPTAWYGLGRSYEGLSRRAFETLQTEAPESVLPPAARRPGPGGPGARQERLSAPTARRSRRSPGSPRPTRPWRRSTSAAATRSGPRSSARRRGRFRSPDCRTASLECDFRAGRYQKALDAARPLRHRGEPLLDLPRRRRAGPRGVRPPRRALPPSPEAALVRVDILRAQRRYLRVEGGAAEGGRGLAGRPADPPGAGDPRLHRPRVRGRPARSWRTC